MQNDLISRSALLHGVDKDIAHMREVAGADKLLNSAVNLVQNTRDFIAQQTAVDAVVLPVKPGDTVWILNHRFAAEIEEIRIREDGVFAVWVEYERSPELTEVWDDGEFDLGEIGKTVFLTVEEWEKAETED